MHTEFGHKAAKSRADRCEGDEGNALEPASVREAHHIQILNLTTIAPVLADCIHLAHKALSMQDILWQTEYRLLADTVVSLHDIIANQQVMT